ncbi:lipoprotein-releasing ABC transporter permease subunit [Thalassotalea litorea]|uniref:lipoprotein-releasing ABC transporter permease subunit n=1 Tax=Thalassotalea litorea TaxID=2020715 RepID=UPI0037366651
MFQPVSLFIGLRYSRSQNRSGFVSFITFFSIAGILLGVTALITVVSVMNGFEGQLKERILGLVPHTVISSEQPIDNWRQVAETLQSDPLISKATPYVESESLVQSATQLSGVLMQGIFPEYELSDSIIEKHMQFGSLSALIPGDYKMVMGASLARSLGVSIGDKVRLLLPTKTIFTPMGRVPVQRTFTVAGVFYLGSQVDNQMVLVHGKDAARLLRRSGEGVNNIRLYLNDAFTAKDVVAQLQTQPLLQNFEFSTWDKTQGNLFAAVKVEKNMMWLMLSLIIAVAAFNIVSALVMVVIDKQGEIGILQTLGMSPTGVLKIFMTQGMVNGIWGTILGSIAGVLVTLNLNSILSLFGVNILGSGFIMQKLPVELRVEQVLVILISALLMSFLATLYPAYRASKTQPAEVLRNE